ncbi:hypothetical protein AB0I60_00620 [Actinosynnema sp. NPDC050436]|uniref:hypothetical protein n=1 Tax=Actinosynnema sp. NPDC050436 TaxID=3155659 RepID=UPI0033F69E7B
MESPWWRGTGRLLLLRWGGGHDSVSGRSGAGAAMRSTREYGRVRVTAVGLLGAALVALVPGVAAADVADPDQVIKCHDLDTEGNSVFGRECDTDHWGPLEHFVITDGKGRAFRCESGWAEGSLWVRGHDCRRIR